MMYRRVKAPGGMLPVSRSNSTAELDFKGGKRGWVG
jgi:hypothetical protein